MKCYKVPELKIFLSIWSYRLYLQYVVYRKRKIYVGPKILLIYPRIKKNTKTKIFITASDQLNADAPITLNALK
jgi:uroporphyrinogen-III synthase